VELEATVRHAAALMQAGNVEGGAALCRQVLAAMPGQPDALHLLAMAARDSDPRAAEALFGDSLARAPRQPSVLVNFGNFLRAQGRVAEGEALLRRAIDLAPDFVPGWYNLGILLRESNRLDDALRCANKVTALAPRYAAGWELLAAIQQRWGNIAAAVVACHEGLRHSTDAARLHYSLAQLLRQDCSFAEAANAYERALRAGYEAPVLYQNHCEALLEAGDTDRALAVLTAGIARYPDSALLHRLRARFHWEAGESGDPVGPLWHAARSHPFDAALWQTLVELLNRLGRKDEGRAALADARTRSCPQTPDLMLLEAIGHAQCGESLAATRLFAQLVEAYPLHTGIKLAFAEHLLVSGDPARAEALCADVLRANPLDQLAWAYRATAWRLLGDPRESWLVDYERMVIRAHVPAPPEYADSAAFFGAVARALEPLHRMRTHPIDQTVRGGTQTNGFLFRLKDPVLRQLEAQVRVAVRAALTDFRSDDGHPFWSRRSANTAGDGFRFAGCWSVRLASQGFHTNHIHPQGWISSALYIALPDEVRGSAESAGHLQFGVPPVEMGLALPAQRLIEPHVGELVLFPSYMWHGTVSFTSKQPRVTVAFDLIPQG
jgi:predicted Zn-dependent protease